MSKRVKVKSESSAPAKPDAPAVGLRDERIAELERLVAAYRKGEEKTLATQLTKAERGATVFALSARVKELTKRKPLVDGERETLDGQIQLLKDAAAKVAKMEPRTEFLGVVLSAWHASFMTGTGKVEWRVTPATPETKQGD